MRPAFPNLGYPDLAMAVTIRRAVSLEDRLLVGQVQHPAFGSGQPLEFYQALRLRIPLRRTGEWWLLLDGVRPVSALMCYPLSLRRDGVVSAAFGLGAVATIPEARRQGFAALLCREAMDRAHEAGRRVGLLFSAVAPAYYERLGFRTLAAHEFRCDRLAEFASSGPQAPLTAVAPLDQVAEFTDLRYRDFRRGEWGVARETAEDWRGSLERNPDDVFLALPDRTGYVRIADDPEGLEVVELIAPDPDRAVQALRKVASMAVGLGRSRVSGWIRPEHAPAEYFTDAGRDKTRPMLLGVELGDTGYFASGDYF